MFVIYEFDLLLTDEFREMV